MYIQPHDVLKRLLQSQAVDEDNSQTVEIWLERTKIGIADAQEAIRFAVAIQKKYYDFRPEMRMMHPVVSIQQVEKDPNLSEDSWKRDYSRPPPAEEDDIYLADIIGERTTKGGRKKYHVRWIGYPLEQAQWLSEENVTDELIAEFTERQALRKQTTLHLEGGQASSPPTDALFTYKIKVPNQGQTRERSVLYISRNTKSFECSYESTERELACVVWTFIKG